jgi:hypothetical protein
MPGISIYQIQNRHLAGKQITNIVLIKPEPDITTINSDDFISIADNS